MRVVLLVIFCCSSLYANSPKNIFGQDNREVIHDYYGGLKRIVSLSTGCTGSFVADRIILTAGHCVTEKIEGVRAVDNGIKIYTERRGKKAKRIYNAKYIFASDYIRTGKKEDDWALILIKEQRSGAYFGYRSFPTKEALSSVSTAGFSKDLDKYLGFQRECRVRSQKVRSSGKKLFYHDCDTKRGASGSPIFKCYGENLTNCFIYAVHSGGYREGGKESLVLDNYSSKYGNYAVPVAQFSSLLGKLREKYKL